MKKKSLLVRLVWEEILFMIKIMQIFCFFAMLLDLIMFFTQGSICHLLLAGVMFVCFDYWMKR